MSPRRVGKALFVTPTGVLSATVDQGSLVTPILAVKVSILWRKFSITTLIFICVYISLSHLITSSPQSLLQHAALACVVRMLNVISVGLPLSAAAAKVMRVMPTCCVKLSPIILVSLPHVDPTHSAQSVTRTMPCVHAIHISREMQTQPEDVSLNVYLMMTVPATQPALTASALTHVLGPVALTLFVRLLNIDLSVPVQLASWATRTPVVILCLSPLTQGKSHLSLQPLLACLLHVA